MTQDRWYGLWAGAPIGEPMSLMALQNVTIKGQREGEGHFDLQSVALPLFVASRLYIIAH